MKTPEEWAGDWQRALDLACDNSPDEQVSRDSCLQVTTKIFGRAIAAARAEGFRAGIEAAAKLVDGSWAIGKDGKDEVIAAIRALKEPGQ